MERRRSKRRTVRRRRRAHQTQFHGSLTWRYFGDGDWPIVLSTPERAVLELLDELPGGETFGDYIR